MIMMMTILAADGRANDVVDFLYHRRKSRDKQNSDICWPEEVPAICVSKTDF